MPGLEKIGFLVALQSNPPAARIAYVLTNTEDTNNMWRIWDPNDIPGTRQKLSAERYAQRLLALLYHASHKAIKVSKTNNSSKKEDKQKTPFIIANIDRNLGHAVNGVYNVIDAPRQYGAIPHHVREGLEPLLIPRSRRGGKDFLRVEIVSDCHERVFFWNVKAEPFASIDFQEYLKKERPICLDPVPTNHPDVQEAISTSQYMSRQTHTWQDLYRKALINSIKIPYFVDNIASVSHEIPNLINHTDESNQVLKQRTAIRITNLLHHHHKVLLTGDAGSGKTTSLQHLALQLAHGDKYPEDMLPIYMPLKWYGLFSATVKSQNSLCEHMGYWITKTICDNIPYEEIIKCDIFAKHSSRNHKPTVASVFDGLYLAIRDSFIRNKNDLSDMVFLLDGYNEIPVNKLPLLEPELEQLTRTNALFVITSRSYGAARILPQFIHINLQEFDKDTIIEYLKLRKKNEAETFFGTRIAPYRTARTMAHVPFYLELLSEFYEVNSGKAPPRCTADLLALFIDRQFVKKHKIILTHFSDLNEPQISFFLRKLAFTLIESNRSAILFPDSTYEVFPTMSYAEFSRYAQAAEAIGFLDKSGIISEQPSRHGFVSFSHDNIRDYFAALELRERNVFENASNARIFLEEMKWDNAWLMMCGILLADSDLTKALNATAEWDPYFATECLFTSPLANNNHTNQLLCKFPKERIEKLIDTGIIPNLARILSFSELEKLKSLYADKETRDYLRRAIPQAIVLAADADAFTILKEMIDQTESSPDKDILHIALTNIYSFQAWDYLVQQHLKAARQNDHNLCMFFNILLNRMQYVPSLAAILDKIKYIEKTKESDITVILDHMVMRSVVRPIEHFGPTRESELLKLRKHPNEIIAEAAIKALSAFGHTSVIEDLVAQAQGMLLDKHEAITALAQYGDPSIDKLLWEHFESDIISPLALGRGFAVVAQLLATRTEKAKLDKMITLAFENDTELAAGALMNFTSAISEYMLKFMKAKYVNVPKNTRLWYRIVSCYALCGDRTRQPELLEILADIDKITFVEERKPWVWRSIDFDQAHCKLFAKTSNQAFRNLVFEALCRLKLFEAIPILEKFFDESVDSFIRGAAYHAYVYLTDLLTETDEQTQRLASEVSRSNHVLDFDLWRLRFERCMEEWAIKTRQEFVKALAVNMEKSLEKEKDRSRQVLLSCISYVRNTCGRRFLDFLAGWPVVPFDEQKPTQNSS
ncbi:MAG: NACHT domain-containing protein [Sedimentisphaerales bacterium]|jgi:HEAT repeat protein